MTQGDKEKTAERRQEIQGRRDERDALEKGRVSSWMRIQRYSEWGREVGVWFEITAGYSGCRGFYTKQNHILLALYPPLEHDRLDHIGQHSARQEEITVVLPCNRKVASQYMEFHLK